MKFLRTDELRLSSVVRHGDWKKNIDEVLVGQMVEDIKAGKGETIGPIGIDERKKLWWGHNRYEAFSRAGAKKIRCDVYRFKNDDEARGAAVRENLRRKNLNAERIAELTRELVALTEKEILAERSKGRIQQPQVAETPEPTTPLGGRPPSVHMEAVRRIAADEDVTRQAIEKRMNPAPNGHANGAAPPAIREEPAPPIRTFGLPLPAAIRDVVAPVIEAIDKADRHNRQVLAELTRWAAVPGADADKARQLHALFQKTAGDMRIARPESLCPYCKGLTTEECMSCRDRRWFTAGDMAAGPVPQELLQDAPDTWVAIGGRPPAPWHPLANGEVPDVF